MGEDEKNSMKTAKKLFKTVYISIIIVFILIFFVSCCEYRFWLVMLVKPTKP
jgi:predicted negative regulator of RcsB-dependent stress response